MNTSFAIEAEGLEKRYGDVQALVDVSLSVETGTVLALLGHNGAGKTTAVGILTTRTEPDHGHALVAGFDVLTHPGEVRKHIGVTAQDVTVDGLLTGVQNLVMIGRLSGLSRKVARVRAYELLERFTLSAAATRLVKGYSGGMRRRLDLAASLMTNPPVLFLDEPTTGLDPASRADVWTVVQQLVAEGSTVLLTTQYLDEADRLADNVIVVGEGRVVAEGSPTQLKQLTGGARLVVTLADASSAEIGLGALASFVSGSPVLGENGTQISAPVGGEPGLATKVVRALDSASVLVNDVEVRQPSLDDVFFSLTGSPKIKESVA